MTPREPVTQNRGSGSGGETELGEEMVCFTSHGHRSRGEVPRAAQGEALIDQTILDLPVTMGMGSGSGSGSTGEMRLQSPQMLGDPQNPPGHPERSLCITPEEEGASLGSPWKRAPSEAVM